MTARVPTTRREVLVGLLLSAAGFAHAQGEQPRDRGIGGTGAAPDVPDGDRGIGGTGVIGTIRRFGSIIVNDLRISYPADAEVRIDGERATAAALKIGHVVRTVAVGREGRLSTNRIEVVSEVVGRIERIGAGTMDLLGQRVETADAEAWRLGERVAVFGQRRTDGTIVASLVEARDTGPSLVAGPVRTLPDGALAIGDLRLLSLDPSLTAGRIVAEGSAVDGGFSVERARPETLDLGAPVRRLSLEAFVDRQGGRVVSGSGYDVPSALASRLPAGRSGLAVVNTRLDGRGRSQVEGIRVGRPESVPNAGRGPGGSAPGREAPGAPGRGGGGSPRGGDPGRGGGAPDRRPSGRDFSPEPSRGDTRGGQGAGGMPGLGGGNDRSGGSPFGGAPGSFGSGSGSFGAGPGGFGGPGGPGGRSR